VTREERAKENRGVWGRSTLLQFGYFYSKLYYSSTPARKMIVITRAFALG
jgi:hypothetical protein